MSLADATTQQLVSELARRGAFPRCKCGRCAWCSRPAARCKCGDTSMTPEVAERLLLYVADHDARF